MRWAAVSAIGAAIPKIPANQRPNRGRKIFISEKSTQSQPSVRIKVSYPRFPCSISGDKKAYNNGVNGHSQIPKRGLMTSCSTIGPLAIPTANKDFSVFCSRDAGSAAGCRIDIRCQNATSFAARRPRSQFDQCFQGHCRCIVPERLSLQSGPLGGAVGIL